MKKILIGIVASILFSIPAYASDPISVAVTGVVAKQAINQLNDAIAARIGQAASAGDYLLEKNYRQLQMVLSNADIVLKDDINLTFDKLSEHEQTYLRTIESLTNKVDEFQNRVLDLESFAAMDVNTILGVLPGVDGNKFLMRRIDGFSQVYKDSGVYSIRLTGQAFTSSNRVSVEIAGQPVELRPFSQTYVMTAEVPVSIINTSFDDKSVKRTSMKIRSWSKHKKYLGLFGEEEKLDLEYETNILLLPKFPVSYEFTEVQKGQGWSDTISSISGQKLASRTGTSGVWNRYLVSTTIPTNSLMIQNTARAWVASGVGAGSWGDWEGNIQYSDNDANGPRTVSRSFAHQIHDQDRTLAIEVSYRTPVAKFGRVPVKLHDPISMKEQPVFLPFDKLYEATLSSEFITYYIRLKYFNGEEVLTTAGKAPGKGIEIGSINKEGYNAVTIEIRNPYERLN